MGDRQLWWIGFNVLIAILLFLDLFVFNKNSQSLTVKTALAWTLFWVSLAATFCIFLWLSMGHEAGTQFITGYVVELSLSMDNLFVFLLLFTFFDTPEKYQHKVLFLGILGAVIFRAVGILGGMALVHSFPVLNYALGALLIFSAIKMLLSNGEEMDAEKNPLLKIIRKYFRITPDYVNGSFFIKRKHKIYATPLFIVLIAVETTDIIFALDSIPAIIGITNDTFIAYSSNIFAILGLRALFFALSGIMSMFRFLKYGLFTILIFIGLKMIVETYGLFEVGIICSLSIVGGILLTSILASLLIPTSRKQKQK